MYYRHFGLDGPPFRFSPSAAVLYLSNAHRECLAALEWTLLHDQCGFMLLVGETGTGKTTLLNAIVARQFPNLHLACVTNPRLSFAEILQVILMQLGVTADVRDKLGSIGALDRLIASAPSGHRVAIAFDEAQDLSDENLEELRLLANRIGSQERDIHFVLMGQPELLDRLADHNLRQLRERIATKVCLTPLSSSESVAYINCRLEAQCGYPQLFEAKAVRHIVKAAQGIPRRLNVLCHNSLVLAYSRGLDTVTLNVAREVIGDYQSMVRPSRLRRGKSVTHSHEIAPAPRSRRPLLSAASACAAVAVVGVGGLSIPRLHNWAGELRRTAASTVASATPGTAPATSDSNVTKVAATLGYTASVSNAVASDATPHIETPAARRAVQIHPGETLHDIATRYLGSKDRTPDLIRANPQLDDPNVLYVGETIYLPSTKPRVVR